MYKGPLIHSLLCSEFVELTLNIEDLPAIKAWLDKGGTSYRGKIFNGFEAIKDRSDKGVTPYNLRNCAYLKDFKKPKIVLGELSDVAKFAYDAEGKYTLEATAFFMTGKQLDYLIGALNSSVSQWLFSKLGTTSGTGTTRWKKYTIEQLLVAKPSDEQYREYQKIYSKYTEGVLDKEGFEKACDQFIYKIYNLDPDEIEYIENVLRSNSNREESQTI